MRVISSINYQALKRTIKAREVPLYIDGVLNLDHPSVVDKIKNASKRVDFKGFQETCHYVIPSGQEK